MKNPLSAACLLSSFLFFGGTALADPVEVNAEWKVGKTYVFSLTMDQNVDMGAQGAMDMKIAVDFAATAAKGDKAGTTRLSCQYDRLALDMDVAGQKMKMDSDHADEAGAVELAKIKEVTFDLIMEDKSGKVVDVENIVNPLDDPGMAKMFSKSELKKMGEMGLKSMPEKPISKGDSWGFTETTEMEGAGKLKIDGKYIYEDVEEVDGHECLKLKMEAALETVGDAEGAQAKISNGKMAGYTYFDAKLANVRKADFDMQMDIEVPTPTGEMMKMPTKQKIGFKLEEIKDAE